MSEKHVLDAQEIGSLAKEAVGLARQAHQLARDALAEQVSTKNSGII